MLSLLRNRSYRVILLANFISMIGSGLNHAAIIWFVLERTGSENAVALLISVITLPSLFFLPFSGVLIDRLDRRYTTMTLDIIRGVAVAIVVYLAFTGRVQVWHIYAMGVVLGLGAFMFWPNMAALSQEMVEAKDVVPLNALVMTGAQAGWMLAGSLVGFLYQRLGLSGVLALDASSYALSALLMFGLRKGKHLVSHGAHAGTEIAFYRDFIDGLKYTVHHRTVLILGVVIALFTAGMMSQNVLTAPLNMKILHTGARGFGFCAAGWSLGAIFSGAYAGTMMRQANGGVSVLWAALLLTGVACAAQPYSGILSIAVVLFFIMGTGRGIIGVAANSGLMRVVPQHLMGRTQNVFTFAGIVLQLILTMGVGYLAEHVSLVAGYFVVGAAYVAGGIMALGVAKDQAPADMPASSGNTSPIS